MISILTTPARLEYLAPFQSYLKALSGTAGFSSDESTALQLAAEEIFVNIVKFGFPDVADATFDLVMDVQPSGLSVLFRVKGMPFDPADIPVYDPLAVLHDELPQGLGTYLAGRMVERIIFRNNGRDGYSIELIKLIVSQRIDRCLPIDALAVHASAGDDGQGAQAAEGYTIRQLKPEEAIEIARCAYEAYGYSYEDYIYYPEKIVELNSSGYMYSLVAVTAQGNIMGHIALKRNSGDELIAEMGVMFVRPAYRKLKIGRQLSQELINAARTMGIHALYTRTVAGHELSQKLAASMGLLDCGIMLGTFPVDVEFKKITGVIRHKQSALVQWIGLAAPRQRTLYISGQLIPQLELLYSRLQLPMTFAAASDAEQPENSRLSATRSAILDIATIEVRTIGTDLVRQVRHQVRLLCLEQIPVIYLYLDMEQLGCREHLQALEDIGFFFGGILPDGMAGHDVLILQYLNNLLIDYDSIHLHNAASNELLTFIRQLDPVQAELARQCCDKGGTLHS